VFSTHTGVGVVGVDGRIKIEQKLHKKMYESVDMT
jgi:hypothetical protein